MSQWPAVGNTDFATQLSLILGGTRHLDGITGATALAAMRTGLHNQETVSAILDTGAFGRFGGRGWEYIAVGYLVGGLFLLWRRIITWHQPLAFIAGLGLTAALFWAIMPDRFPSPLFHLASGGAMLGAFFIVTDPVTSASTPLGKIIFAAGVGVIAWLVRTFGMYPEGVAFGVLLMNIAVPLIDRKTQPSVFGERAEKRP